MKQEESHSVRGGSVNYSQECKDEQMRLMKYFQKFGFKPVSKDSCAMWLKSL